MDRGISLMLSSSSLTLPLVVTLCAATLVDAAYSTNAGILTWFTDGGYGACNTPINARTEQLVAVSYLWFQDYDTNGPGSGTEQFCNDRCIHIQGPRGTFILPVRDECASCTREHVDASQPSFMALAGDLDIGLVHGLTWTFVSCSSGNQTENLKVSTSTKAVANRPTSKPLALPSVPSRTVKEHATKVKSYVTTNVPLTLPASVQQSYSIPTSVQIKAPSSASVEKTSVQTPEPSSIVMSVLQLTNNSGVKIAEEKGFGTVTRAGAVLPLALGIAAFAFA